MIKDDGYQDNVYSLVPAGGEGARIRARIQASFGVSDPKQFCFLHGK
ncbi:MAG: hypothetical protein ABIJ45_00785 [Candidatus Zixiibacteriota bacterium]